jgi:hypothetical protein
VDHRCEHHSVPRTRSRANARPCRLDGTPRRPRVSRLSARFVRRRTTTEDTGIGAPDLGNTGGGEIPTVVAIVEATGGLVEKTEPEAEAATPKPKKTKNAPEWKSLPDAEKAQYLLDHQTISDRTSTEDSRLKGEKRDAFIHRIPGFPKTP